MKRKNYSKIFAQGVATLLAAALLVSCNVDDSYDLATIDDSNIGIGTDESIFNLPLVEVTMSVSDLTTTTDDDSMGSDTYGRDGLEDDGLEDDGLEDDGLESSDDITSLLNDFTSLMPSLLTGDYANGINIEKLKTNDDNYVTNLVDILFEEIETNETKRLNFCTFLSENQTDYPDIVAELKDLGVDTDGTAQDWADDLGTIMAEAEDGDLDDVQGYVVTGISDYAQDIVTSYSLEETELDESIAVDQDTIDLISKNLDGLANTIRLIAKITTDLPLDIVVKPYIILEDGTKIYIADIDGLNGLESTEITEEQLNEMLGTFKFAVDISFEHYQPNGVEDTSNCYLKLTLFLRKTGGITF